MKKIPLLMLFAVASLALQAQDFTENFEHGGSLPEGWTAYSSGSTYKWSVAKYSTFGKYYLHLWYSSHCGTPHSP